MSFEGKHEMKLLSDIKSERITGTTRNIKGTVLSRRERVLIRNKNTDERINHTRKANI